MRDEADILVRLNHPVIVAVHELVEFEDQIGLVIEYVDGLDSRSASPIRSSRSRSRPPWR